MSDINKKIDEIVSIKDELWKLDRKLSTAYYSLQHIIGIDSTSLDNVRENLLAANNYLKEQDSTCRLSETNIQGAYHSYLQKAGKEGKVYILTKCQYWNPDNKPPIFYPDKLTREQIKISGPTFYFTENVEDIYVEFYNTFRGRMIDLVEFESEEDAKLYLELNEK